MTKEQQQKVLRGAVALVIFNGFVAKLGAMNRPDTESMINQSLLMADQFIGVSGLHVLLEEGD